MPSTGLTPVGSERDAFFDDIESFCNRTRLRSSFGDFDPINFESNLN
jgi:hypothetical protein